MEVKKNQLSGYIHQVQSSNHNKQADQKVLNSSTGTEEKYDNKNLDFNMLKSRVKNIESEVSKMQTVISEKQIQIGYLENMEYTEDWRQLFKTNMKSKTVQVDENLLNNETSESYLSKMHNEISSMKNELLKKEIQIQNIFSLNQNKELDYNMNNIEISKDIKDAEKIFSNIESKSVSKLLQ